MTGWISEVGEERYLGTRILVRRGGRLDEGPVAPFFAEMIEYTLEIESSSEKAFEISQDYGVRLDWDVAKKDWSFCTRRGGEGDAPSRSFLTRGMMLHCKT